MSSDINRFMMINQSIYNKIISLNYISFMLWPRIFPFWQYIHVHMLIDSLVFFILHFIEYGYFSLSKNTQLIYTQWRDFLLWFWENPFYFFSQHDIYKVMYAFAYNFKGLTDSLGLYLVQQIYYRRLCPHSNLNAQREHSFLCSAKLFSRWKIHFQI